MTIMIRNIDGNKDRDSQFFTNSIVLRGLADLTPYELVDRLFSRIHDTKNANRGNRGNYLEFSPVSKVRFASDRIWNMASVPEPERPVYGDHIVRMHCFRLAIRHGDITGSGNNYVCLHNAVVRRLGELIENEVDYDKLQLQVNRPETKAINKKFIDFIYVDKREGTVNQIEKMRKNKSLVVYVNVVVMTNYRIHAEKLRNEEIDNTDACFATSRFRDPTEIRNDNIWRIRKIADMVFRSFLFVSMGGEDAGKITSSKQVRNLNDNLIMNARFSYHGWKDEQDGRKKTEKRMVMTGQQVNFRSDCDPESVPGDVAFSFDLTDVSYFLGTIDKVIKDFKEKCGNFTLSAFNDALNDAMDAGVVQVPYVKKWKVRKSKGHKTPFFEMKERFDATGNEYFIDKHQMMECLHRIFSDAAKSLSEILGLTLDDNGNGLHGKLFVSNIKINYTKGLKPLCIRYEGEWPEPKLIKGPDVDYDDASIEVDKSHDELDIHYVVTDERDTDGKDIWKINPRGSEDRLMEFEELEENEPYLVLTKEYDNIDRAGKHKGFMKHLIGVGEYVKKGITINQVRDEYAKYRGNRDKDKNRNPYIREDIDFYTAVKIAKSFNANHKDDKKSGKHFITQGVCIENCIRGTVEDKIGLPYGIHEKLKYGLLMKQCVSEGKIPWSSHLDDILGTGNMGNTLICLHFQRHVGSGKETCHVDFAAIAVSPSSEPSSKRTTCKFREFLDIKKSDVEATLCENISDAIRSDQVAKKVTEFFLSEKNTDTLMNIYVVKRKDGSFVIIRNVMERNHGVENYIVEPAGRHRNVNRWSSHSHTMNLLLQIQEIKQYEKEELGKIANSFPYPENGYIDGWRISKDGRIEYDSNLFGVISSKGSTPLGYVKADKAFNNIDLLEPKSGGNYLLLPYPCNSEDAVMIDGRADGESLVFTQHQTDNDWSRSCPMMTIRADVMDAKGNAVNLPHAIANIPPGEKMEYRPDGSVSTVEDCTLAMIYMRTYNIAFRGNGDDRADSNNKIEDKGTSNVKHISDGTIFRHLIDNEFK